MAKSGNIQLSENTDSGLLYLARNSDTDFIHLIENTGSDPLLLVRNSDVGIINLIPNTQSGFLFLTGAGQLVFVRADSTLRFADTTDLSADYAL